MVFDYSAITYKYEYDPTKPDNKGKIKGFELPYLTCDKLNREDKKYIAQKLREEGMSISKIAEQLDIPLGTVKRWVAKPKTEQNQEYQISITVSIPLELLEILKRVESIKG